MKISGRLIISNKSINYATVNFNDDSLDFHGNLETAFIMLCKKLAISTPVWMTKNTKELSICKKTSFDKEQFVEEFSYDLFEFRIDKL